MAHIERSYLSLLLQADPEFYARSRNTSRAEYKFSNGREFKGHDLYSNYFPLEFAVTDQGELVFDEGEQVFEELSWEDYLAEYAT